MKLSIIPTPVCSFRKLFVVPKLARFTSVALVLAVGVGHAATTVDQGFMFPKNISNGIINVIPEKNVPIKLLATKDNSALSVIAFNVDFFQEEAVSNVNGLKYLEKVPVFDGNAEVKTRHSTNANCVEESFGLVRKGDDLELIQSSKYYAPDAKGVPNLTEPAKQKLQIFKLIDTSTNQKLEHKFHFQKDSEVVTKETACTNDEVSKLLSIYK